MGLSWFLEVARAHAEASCLPQRHGAVLVQQGTIIGAGCNLDKTHPASRHPWHNQHAELSAIRHADRKLRARTPRHGGKEFVGTVLYSVRVLPNGSFGAARPCLSCQSVLKDRGIITWVYTLPDGRLAKEQLLNQ